MASYFLAPSLDELRTEINNKYPKRDKSSDGWIGDTSHAARPSDHNPDWSAGGLVRAIDVDNNGAVGELTPLVKDVLAAAIGDPRVWYVIWNRKIYSRTYGWKPRAYTGTNPHDHHVHISILHTAAAAASRVPWLTKENPKNVGVQVDLSNVRNQFLIAAGLREGKKEALVGVRRIKRALNDEYGYNLTDDGFVRRATLRAWAHHESVVGRSGRSNIPDPKTLAALSKGRFKVVA